MKTEHVIVCGGLKAKQTGAVPGLELNAWPGAGKTNIRLDILDLNEKFCTTVSGRFYDLLDIATYVFQGDQMFSRGKLDVDNFGSRWRRHLHYHIPVREPDFWKDAAVQKALRDTLDFLSDDFYTFSFYPGKGWPGMQEYLNYGNTVAGLQPPQAVTMFSGGLDSLGGAIHEIVRNKQHVALVNHQSTDKFGRTYNELLKRLRAKCGLFQPMHVRVEINKKGIEGKDHHQRARSFLFAALGGTVATMLGLREVRFYENGVLSLNVPICGQLVGARATRTTHPRVIAGYESLLSLVAGRKFEVNAPFLWHTKGDVVKEIREAGCESLIPVSRSCAHTWQTDNDEPHCGVCSQCLDRRIAVLAGHCEQHDPLDRYGIDIFTEARPSKEDKILGAGYIERANQIAAMRDSSEFLCRYPEVARVIPFTGMNAGAAAERIFTLYRKHADEVKEAVRRLVAQHSLAIVERTLPGDCLLRSVVESGSVTSTPMAPPALEEPDAKESVRTRGRLRWLTSCDTVWLDGNPHDLRKRKRARACLKYLTSNQAFDEDSARHLVDEIDLYVREQMGLAAALHSTVKIQDYFKDGGELRALCREIVTPVAGDGRYYLKVD